MSAVLKQVLFRPFKGDFGKLARVQTGIIKGAFKMQATSGCVGASKSLARAMAGVQGKNWKTIAESYPTADAVAMALQKGPCVLNANNIAQEGSSYVGHHAVTLVQMLDKENVLVADLDDTVKREGSSVGNFLYEANLKDLLAKSRPPMNTNLDGDLQQVDPMVVQPVEGGSMCIVM